MDAPLTRVRTIVTALLLACCANARAQVDADTLKAAFVYNFVLYTTWPVPLRDTAVVTLCVRSTSTMAPALQALAGKRVDTRKLAVRAIGAGAAGDGCDVRIVDSGEGAPSAAPGVLTICDCSDDAAAEGAMIALIREDTRLRFDVNRGAAESARLSLSSKLLHLARAVR
jgi:uncharacterized protein DUF4154